MENNEDETFRRLKYSDRDFQVKYYRNGIDNGISMHHIPSGIYLETIDTIPGSELEEMIKSMKNRIIEQLEEDNGQ
jgi:hypothetical protein